MAVAYDYVMCPECKTERAALIPKGGDGSALVFRRHRTWSGKLCPESRQEVPATRRGGRG